MILPLKPPCSSLGPPACAHGLALCDSPSLPCSAVTPRSHSTHKQRSNLTATPRQSASLPAGMKGEGAHVPGDTHPKPPPCPRDTSPPPPPSSERPLGPSWRRFMAALSSGEAAERCDSTSAAGRRQKKKGFYGTRRSGSCSLQSNGSDCDGTLKGSSPGAVAAPGPAQLERLQMWVGIYSTATKDKEGGVEHCLEHSSAAGQQTVINLLQHTNIWPCTSHRLAGRGGKVKLCLRVAAQTAAGQHSSRCEHRDSTAVSCPISSVDNPLGAAPSPVHNPLGAAPSPL